VLVGQNRVNVVEDDHWGRERKMNKYPSTPTRWSIDSIEALPITRSWSRGSTSIREGSTQA